MFEFLNFIPAVRQLLKTISWAKIAQVTVLFLVLFLAWITYATRDTIVQYITENHNIHSNEELTPDITHLSKTTQQDIKTIVNNSPVISMISVEVLNFRTNSRYTIFMYTSDAQLDNVYHDQHYGMVQVPIFRENTTYNRRLIGLINGEFECDPFTNTDESVTKPTLNSFVNFVCSSGIPPYYGKIVGILNIYLRQRPSNNDIDQLRIVSQTLSSELYERDLRNAN